MGGGGGDGSRRSGGFDARGREGVSGGGGFIGRGTEVVERGNVCGGERRESGERGVERGGGGEGGVGVCRTTLRRGEEGGATSWPVSGAVELLTKGVGRETRCLEVRGVVCSDRVARRGSRTIGLRQRTSWGRFARVSRESLGSGGCLELCAGLQKTGGPCDPGWSASRGWGRGEAWPFRHLPGKLG